MVTLRIDFVTTKFFLSRKRGLTVESKVRGLFRSQNPFPLYFLCYISSNNFHWPWKWTKVWLIYMLNPLYMHTEKNGQSLRMISNRPEQTVAIVLAKSSRVTPPCYLKNNKIKKCIIKTWSKLWEHDFHLILLHRLNTLCIYLLLPYGSSYKETGLQWWVHKVENNSKSDV